SGASRKALVLLALCLLSSRALGLPQFQYAAGATALVWLSTRPLVGGAYLRPLIFLGKISYPLYLVHQYVGYVVMRGLYAQGLSPGAAIALATAVAIVAATALHLAVERPSLELLRRRRTSR